MPKLRAEAIANLDTVEGMRTTLQNAIELEHATLPTYLYAMFSIKPDDPNANPPYKNPNGESYNLILSVVLEEMLHMGLACNILNAIGGSPAIDDPNFIPTYPGPLPCGVEGDLIVPLAPFSLDLLKNVFMVIEEPEDPQNYPVIKDTEAPVTELTIGEFYEAIKAGLDALTKVDPNIWVPNNNQVTGTLPGLTAVNDYPSAATAIDLIVGQGEGTSTDPMEPGSTTEPAHYYRFEEIVNGRMLVADPTSPLGYSYSGAPIPFDPTGVYPVVENPKLADYLPETSPAWIACNTFNATYSSLLKCLHSTFNGSPGDMNTAVNLMFTLLSDAGNVMSIDLGNGTNAGPSFEYQADAPNPCAPTDS
jgi:hypothetical protein